jgi:hypothetical protein
MLKRVMGVDWIALDFMRRVIANVSVDAMQAYLGTISPTQRTPGLDVVCPSRRRWNGTSYAARAPVGFRWLNNQRNQGHVSGGGRSKG